MVIGQKKCQRRCVRNDTVWGKAKENKARTEWTYVQVPLRTRSQRDRKYTPRTALRNPRAIAHVWENNIEKRCLILNKTMIRRSKTWWELRGNAAGKKSTYKKGNQKCEIRISVKKKLILTKGKRSRYSQQVFQWIKDELDLENSLKCTKVIKEIFEYLPEHREDEGRRKIVNDEIVVYMQR